MRFLCTSRAGSKVPAVSHQNPGTSQLPIPLSIPTIVLLKPAFLGLSGVGKEGACWAWCSQLPAHSPGAGSSCIVGWFMAPFASADICYQASKCQSWQWGCRQCEQVGCVNLWGLTNSHGFMGNKLMMVVDTKPYSGCRWVSNSLLTGREGRRPVMIRLPLILLSKIALKVSCILHWLFSCLAFLKQWQVLLKIMSTSVNCTRLPVCGAGCLLYLLR